MRVTWRSAGVFTLVASAVADTTAPPLAATEAPTSSGNDHTTFKPAAENCDDTTGLECCDVTGSNNDECWTNLNWAKQHLGGAAPFGWYKDYDVNEEMKGTDIPDTAMQCILWHKQLTNKSKADKYPSRIHNCPRPCIEEGADKIHGLKCPLPAEPVASEDDKKKEDSPSMPLWAIILLCLVAAGAIIGAVITYLSNDKKPEKKKKKRGLASAAPQKKAPEAPEPVLSQPEPIVTTAAPIYTTATPLTYTVAAPVSAGSFVYAPQQVVTTGVPAGSVYQQPVAAAQQFITTGVPSAGSMYQQPVLAQGMPIATSQPIYNSA